MNQRIHDHGEHDDCLPIPFDLGSWTHVARKAREDIELSTGRALTDITGNDINSVSPKL